MNNSIHSGLVSYGSGASLPYCCSTQLDKMKNRDTMTAVRIVHPFIIIFILRINYAQLSATTMLRLVINQTQLFRVYHYFTVIIQSLLHNLTKFKPFQISLGYNSPFAHIFNRSRKMEGPKKKSIKLPVAAYEIYQNHQNQIHYPHMLGAFMLSTKSQFQLNRAVRLLADWLIEYKDMNQIIKHKYLNQIPKVLKSLYALFNAEADISICLAPYYYEFFNQWKELTELIQTKLIQGNIYALRFIWYLSFDFCEKIDAERQFEFNIYLSQNFQDALLQFENPDEMSFKPLLQTIRMINIQKSKQDFVQNAIPWAQKMIKLYESCTVPTLKSQILIEIIGCRGFLVMKPQTNDFWLAMVEVFFSQIQKRLPDIMLTNQVDIKLLDWMTVIINFEQIQSFLVKNKKRFLKTLISKMKKNPDPKNAFHYEKYYSLRNILINLFFFVKKDESIKQMEEILTQFNRKSLSVLKDSQENIQFFDCMCEAKLPITKTNIIQIIKALANGHSRKSFPVHVLIILVRVLHSASEEQLSEQNLSSIIKSLSECIASKINDPNIFELRAEISRFYITLAKKYLWNDQKSTQIMLLWCEQFQRNNKLSSPETIILLSMLTKKHKEVVFSAFNHKLQGVVTDITYKLKFNKVYNNIPLFVSLLMCLYLKIDWKISHKFIAQICSENTEDLTFLYLYQSEILTRPNEGVSISQKELKQLKYIIGEKQMWKKPSRLNVYLYCIELYFMKISKEDAIMIIKEIDSILLKLFEQMYEDVMYHQMIHLAARVFFRAGDIKILKELKSYKFFKQQSFQILSKSFHKQTIMLMTYMYCMLMDRADNLESFFLQLNEEKFLNSLFQGWDEFVGKSSRFNQEQCYIILLVMKTKESISICGHSSLLYLKDIQKNVVWWQEADYKVSFKLPQQEESPTNSLLIEEFREYYEQQISQYFKEELNNLLNHQSKPKVKDNELEQDPDDLS